MSGSLVAVGVEAPELAAVVRNRELGIRRSRHDEHPEWPFDTTLRYTTNGLDPTESSTAVPANGMVHLAPGTTLKAKAWKTGCSRAASRSDLYVWSALPIENVVWTQASSGGRQRQHAHAADGARRRVRRVAGGLRASVGLHGDGFVEFHGGAPSSRWLAGLSNGNKQRRPLEHRFRFLALIPALPLTRSKAQIRWSGFRLREARRGRSAPRGRGIRRGLLPAQRRPRLSRRPFHRRTPWCWKASSKCRHHDQRRRHRLGNFASRPVRRASPSTTSRSRKATASRRTPPSRFR